MSSDKKELLLIKNNRYIIKKEGVAVMNEFRFSLAVDSAQVLRFFHSNLRDVVEEKAFRQDELLYVASVLAHFAQTSRWDRGGNPTPISLSEVFDTFVVPSEPELRDPDILEIGGSQTLLFTGFFRDQMRRRHNIEWFEYHGQSFYERASKFSSDAKRRELLIRMVMSFTFWARACGELSRNLRDNPLLLRKQ